MEQFNYVRVAAAVPETKVANPAFNVQKILDLWDELEKKEADIIVFPELCIPGYSCGELFNQKMLQDSSSEALKILLEASKSRDAIVILGSIFNFNDVLYNCAFVIYHGEILGIVPKIFLPSKNEFYDKRWFISGRDLDLESVNILGQDVPWGSILFKDNSFGLNFGVEICEDLWAPLPPSSFLYLKGAQLIFNLSASNSLVAKSDYRRSLVAQQSARFNGAYIYSSAGVHESTTDYLMDGHAIIAENGIVLKENERFERTGNYIISDIDISFLQGQRLRNSSFSDSQSYIDVSELPLKNFIFTGKKKTNFEKYINPLPFVPDNPENKNARCKEIFNIQSGALTKRLEHSGLQKVVIGISGGLDSTLAFLVVAHTFELLGLSNKNIIAVTMPGFGTTDLTYQNSKALIKAYEATFMEINIEAACKLHFEMIGHSTDVHDITYENVQARERTALLMNLSNKHQGLVIGTGDLSELALGWCTYNGDHMSMYGINNSIPKTLVKHLVQWVADSEKKEIQDILVSIINTPISPELLPKTTSGKIEQKTEDILGPYLVHDFFLYNFIKNGFTPKKLLFLSEIAFKDSFSKEQLQRWLKIFLQRFFTQQFKRSCLPDGPKVGSVSLSPRADWKMPSDADYTIWLNEI